MIPAANNHSINAGGIFPCEMIAHEKQLESAMQYRRLSSRFLALLEILISFLLIFVVGVTRGLGHFIRLVKKPGLLFAESLSVENLEKTQGQPLIPNRSITLEMKLIELARRDNVWI